jgi:hypothetical protein
VEHLHYMLKVNVEMNIEVFVTITIPRKQ